MPLLSLQGVTLNLGGQALLKEVDFSIEPCERVCLTGRNGAGKSSLLALLGGQIEPDKGIITRSGAFFGQMPQVVPAHWRGSVFSLVTAPQEDGGEEPSKGAASGASRGKHAHSTQAAASHLEDINDWEKYGEALGIINHLGLDPDADFNTLSGGTKRRVALARALLCSNDLILDEPTNHLDLSTITWLEEFLLRKSRTLVFVSHDRAFAQRLATRMVEVDRGKLYSYSCTYAQYAERREERLEIEERHFALFNRKLAQEETWIRQGIKARRTRNMGRVRALQSMRAERSARRERQSNVVMYAQEAERSGKLVIKTDNISFAYPGEKPLFSGFSTVIQRGDRVGLIGNNGTGKSTLLRLLLGELEPTEGTVRHGTQLQVSYFDQMRETLNPEDTVMHSVAEGNDVVTIDGNTRHVAGYLQDFLFTSDRLRLPVKVLSGGERNRLLLAKLFTRPSNLLVLDEPTNDLDMETLELLEDLLAGYTGTVLMVSHDRSFLDNLATSVLALEGDGLVHEYVGAYTDWLRQRAAPASAGKNAARRECVSENAGATLDKNPLAPAKAKANKQPVAAPAKANKQPVAAPAEAKARKLSFKEQRELEQITADIKALPGRLAALEKEQKTLESTLAAPDFFARDHKGFMEATNRITALDEKQTELLLQWETMEKRREELTGEGK